ncbi:MAG: DUF2283 domain-containing protein [Chloroflexi bacterium]|nr:DUF2283 domain-containing protein [Chloroflexota bacterium]MYC07679.1 DUF2283 domain-containing protein [Chloroflexota bacterium]
MKIQYDDEVDALYILLKDSQPVDARDIGEGVVADFDEQGDIVGLEVLYAAEKLGLESILTVTIDTMLVDQPS